MTTAFVILGAAFIIAGAAFVISELRWNARVQRMAAVQADNQACAERAVGEIRNPHPQART